jgi:hypothetical protein
MDAVMDRWRCAAMGLVFMGMLSGCAEMRWFRDCCCCRDTQPKAAVSGEIVDAQRTHEANNGALSIPGGAQQPRLAALDKTTPPSPPRSAADTATPQSTSAVPSPIVPVSATTPALHSPEPAPSVAEAQSPLRALHARARQKFESINAYEMRMRRREVVAGKAKPEELIEARFRREPFSVYFKWVGPEAKGREVVYVHGAHGGMIHTLTAKNDVPLMPAGMRFKVAPDSPMVKGKSRTSITEAGLGSLIDRFGKLVDAVERGDARHGTAKAMGAFKRTEFEQKVEGVMQTIPPGVEPLLPGGGQRLWCFDIEHGLPVLVVTHDEQSREVEYYCHDRFAFPPHLGDEAFDPEVLWRR